MPKQEQIFLEKTKEILIKNLELFIKYNQEDFKIAYIAGNFTEKITYSNGTSITIDYKNDFHDFKKLVLNCKEPKHLQDICKHKIFNQVICVFCLSIHKNNSDKQLLEELMKNQVIPNIYIIISNLMPYIGRVTDLAFNKNNKLSPLEVLNIIKLIIPYTTQDEVKKDSLKIILRIHEATCKTKDKKHEQNLKILELFILELINHGAIIDTETLEIVKNNDTLKALLTNYPAQFKKKQILTLFTAALPKDPSVLHETFFSNDLCELHLLPLVYKFLP